MCATGRARAYGPEYFSPGQTVLDVGINFDAAGNLCGDVDFGAVEPVLGPEGRHHAGAPRPRRRDYERHYGPRGAGGRGWAALGADDS